MTTAGLFDLTGKTAFVTGAGSGLGFAMAECFAENGAKVVLAELNRTNLDAALAKLADRGFTCDGRIVDAAHSKQIESAMDCTRKEFGALDIVVANAGISAGPGPMTDIGTIENVAPERWREVLDINLSGVFSTIQCAARHMKAQRSGRIIVTASTAGFRGDPMVGYAYAATKAAVVNLVRQAAMDLARFDVHINAIAPGPFRTSIGGGRMRQSETESAFAETLPLGRIGNPDEIKGAALLLASKASSFMTGAIIPVDGGALSW
ncbi:MAG: SDR family oxidoreductase [Proteobacteria bacterium]|nr:SDR family oxidoreductase [Pseudomonadota bacterium]